VTFLTYKDRKRILVNKNLRNFQDLIMNPFFSIIFLRLPVVLGNEMVEEDKFSILISIN